MAEEQEHQLGDFHEEMPSMEGYDKPIKKARNILFALAGIQIIFTFFLVRDLEDLALYITMAISFGIAAIFFALGLWTKYKPYTAIVTALVIYISLLLIDVISDPASILRGVLIKILAISLMVSALKNAKEVQQWLDLAKKNK